MNNRPSPFPEDFGEWLEDLSGISLEKFARAFGLSEERAREWRSGGMPTTDKVWAKALWADRVPGGIEVLLAPYSQPWGVGRKLMGRQQELVYQVEREEFPRTSPSASTGSGRPQGCPGGSWPDV